MTEKNSSVYQKASLLLSVETSQDVLWSLNKSEQVSDDVSFSNYLMIYIPWTYVFLQTEVAAASVASQ